jgi:hypothetical protein
VQFSYEYFKRTPPAALFTQGIEGTTRLYVPLATEHYERFEQQSHLDAEMRRRGPLGYGHYAFLTTRDARQHAQWLLGDAAAKRCNVACLALPVIDPIDWKLISAMPGSFPEEQVTHWNMANGGPVRTCRTLVEQVEDSSPIYCFYEEQIGAPWPQAGAQ